MSLHFYSQDGVLVAPFTKGSYPSVTTVLDVAAKPALDDWKERVGAEEAERKGQEARERGTAVHELVEAINNGKVDEYVPEALEGYVGGYKRWLIYSEANVISAELFLTSHKYKYSGTADIIAGIDGELWIIDIKTSAKHQDSHGLQLKAYQQAYYEMTGKRAKMAVLRLTDKTAKGWQWKEYNEPFKPFLGLLSYFNWTVKKRKPVKVSTDWAPDDL